MLASIEGEHVICISEKKNRSGFVEAHSHCVPILTFITPVPSLASSVPR